MIFHVVNTSIKTFLNSGDFNMDIFKENFTIIIFRQCYYHLMCTENYYILFFNAFTRIYNSSNQALQYYFFPHSQNRQFITLIYKT